MLQGLILIEAVSSAFWEKNEKRKGKKKEKRSGQELFTLGPEPDTTCCLSTFFMSIVVVLYY
jgi:hypothetical protein